MYILTLFLFIWMLYGERFPDEIPWIVEDDIPGICVTDTKEFKGPALWGYINGGADLYLEYGFDKLYAEKIKFDGRQYSIDVYKMLNSASAYGIFSVSHTNCTGRLGNMKFTCINPFQVQIAKGSYYISVINEKGTPAEQILSKKIAEIIVKKCNGADYEVPVLFKKESLKPFIDNIKLMNGRLGLENGFPLWAEYFENLDGFTITLLPIVLDNSKVYIAQVEFVDEDVLKAFIQNMGADPEEILNSSTFINGQNKYLKINGLNKLVFIESSGEPPLIKKCIKLLDFEY